jgi:hypothetical protein
MNNRCCWNEIGVGLGQPASAPGRKRISYKDDELGLLLNVEVLDWLIACANDKVIRRR